MKLTRNKNKNFLDSRLNAAVTSHSLSPANTKHQNWCQNIPSGYPSAPETFKHENALLALVFAYYFSLWSDGTDPATYRMLCHHCSRKVSDRDEVGKYIMFLTQPFRKKLMNKCFDSIELLAKSLIGQKIFFCDFSGQFTFDVQLHIFSRTSSSLLATIPKTFMSAKRQLFFLGNLINGQICQLEVITDIEKYFSIFGYFCFFCSNYFKSKGAQHKCKKTTSCFCCRRPIQTPEIYKFSKNYFCNSGISANISQKCSKCNIRLFSESCATQHKKVCKNGWFCDLCQKYTFRSRFLKSRNEIAKKHICGQDPCSFCGEIKSYNHSCPLQSCVLPQQNQITHMGFIDCQFTGQIDANCQACLNKSCSFCTDNTNAQINICSILHETENRYIFDEWTFSDFSPPRLQRNVLMSQYCSREIGPQKKNKAKVKCKILTPREPLECFLSFLFEKDICSTTYLIFDQGSRILEQIIKCLLRNMIKPKVIAAPHIYMVQIREIKVQFVNVKNYFDETFFSLLSKNKIKVPFFPLRWNKRSMYMYNDAAPKLMDFFYFDDTLAELEAKKEYVKEIQKNKFNFKKELELFSSIRAKSLGMVILKFLKTSFQCQTLLRKFLKVAETKERFPYVHPFQYPVFTRASYSFRLLRTFCINFTKIRQMLPPISMQSSLAEIEYCSFLRWLYPKEEFQDAWSTYGQKKFKESFPDSYSSSMKKAFFFNGCLIHGHPVSKCNLNRSKTAKKNYFDIPFEQAFQNFTQKKRKLEINHPEEISEIVTEWECTWKSKKKLKLDPKLNFFLQHVYTNPPNYRLDASKSGKK